MVIPNYVNTNLSCTSDFKCCQSKLHLHGSLHGIEGTMWKILNRAWTILPLSQNNVLPPRFVCPKMVVQFICPARNLRLKVKKNHVKLSSSRRLSTLQLLGGGFGVVVVFYCKSHSYNCSVNGQRALFSPKSRT